MPLAFLILAALGASLAAADEPGPWAELARRDLEAVRRLVEENHPGPLDEENPSFKRWLDEGFREASALARRADSFEGYSFALQRYVAGFRDGHLGLGLDIGRKRLAWPRFLVALREGRYVVESPEEGEGLPRKGALLVSCDGRAPELLMRENIFGYSPEHPDLEAAWEGLAAWLLIDEGNPFVSRPKSCLFETHGARRELDLEWTEVSRDELRRTLRNAAFGPAPKLEVRSFAPGAWWASFPSFSIETAKAGPMREAIAELARRKDERLIVLDVRGNSGGNSEWGVEIFQTLYGARPPGDGSRVDWRVSEANLAHLRKLKPLLLEQFGRKSPITKGFAETEAGMARALKRGQAFYREPEGKPARRAALRRPPGKIVFLTDGRCGSACLDFADFLMGSEGVLHAGRPTHADTQYMEAAAFDLPSRAGKLILPLKVYRGRRRGPNEAYIPSARWPGSMADTSALERWILGLGDAAAPVQPAQ